MYRLYFICFILLFLAPIGFAGAEGAVAVQGVTATISGTVQTYDGRPIATATLTLDNNQSISIHPTTGAFSIPSKVGETYQLTISSPDWIFVNPDIQGELHGDLELKFVGFPK